MSWEPVKLTGSRGKARITIRKNGQIGLNATLLEKYQVKQFKYMKIYFDKVHRKIGLELTNSEDGENCTEITFRERNTYVSASALMNRYDIDPDKEYPSPVEFEESTGMLVTQLEKGGTTEEETEE